MYSHLYAKLFALQSVESGFAGGEARSVRETAGQRPARSGGIGSTGEGNRAGKRGSFQPSVLSARAANEGDAGKR